MAAGGQNNDFQTFLDSEKTPALWEKYEEIENFETVAGFSIFTETGS